MAVQGIQARLIMLNSDIVYGPAPGPRGFFDPESGNTTPGSQIVGAPWNNDGRTIVNNPNLHPFGRTDEGR